MADKVPSGITLDTAPPAGVTLDPPPGSVPDPDRDKTSFFQSKPVQPHPGQMKALLRGIEEAPGDVATGAAQLGVRGKRFATAPETKQKIDEFARQREKEYKKDPAVKAHPAAAAVGDIGTELLLTLPLFGGDVADIAALGGGRFAGPWVTKIPSLARRLGNLATAGADVGAVQPVTGTKDYGLASRVLGPYGAQKAGDIVESAGGAMLLGPAGEFLGWAGGKAGRALLPYATMTMEERAAARAAGVIAKREEKAGKEVTERLEQSRRSQGLTSTDIMKDFREAQEKGQPYRLIDIDESRAGPLHKLGTDVYTSPGEAGARMKHLQKERTTKPVQDDPALAAVIPGQSMRLMGEIKSNLGNQSAREVAEDLIQKRSRESAPLWKRAMRRPSKWVPLEHQLGDELNEATRTVSEAQQQQAAAERVLTQAEGRDTQLHERTGGVIWPSRIAPNQDEIDKAYLAVDQAKVAVRQAQDNAEKIRAQLQRSQSDATLIKEGKEPGAYWSPKLESILNDADARRGLNLAIRNEIRNAHAENRRPDILDRIIVLHPETGQPILNNAGEYIYKDVPSMEMIQMAKEGLDAMLDDPQYRDPLTRRLTKTGQSIDNLRRNLLAEGDRLNPDWKAAREVWSGRSSMLEALKQGRAVFGRGGSPDGREGLWQTDWFTQSWGEMNAGEREAFKAGMADKMITDILSTRMNRNAAQHSIMNTPLYQIVMRTVFGKDVEGFEQFNRFIEREVKIGLTGSDVMGGSPTHGFMEAKEEARRTAGTEGFGARAMQAGKSLIRGRVWEAGEQALMALKNLAQRPPVRDPDEAMALVKLLMEHTDIREMPDGTLQVGPRIPPGNRPVQRAGRAVGGDIGALVAPQMLTPSQQTWTEGQQ